MPPYLNCLNCLNWEFFLRCLRCCFGRNRCPESRRELEVARPLLLKTPECEFLLYPQELRYLEADNKDTILYYMEDTITLRRGLNDMEDLLSPFFFCRVHRKYLVNLSHVREFDERRLTLDCGRTIPVSRRRSGAFRLALKNYIEGDMRK